MFSTTGCPSRCVCEVTEVKTDCLIRQSHTAENGRETVAPSHTLEEAPGAGKKGPFKPFPRALGFEWPPLPFCPLHLKAGGASGNF